MTAPQTKAAQTGRSRLRRGGGAFPAKSADFSAPYHIPCFKSLKYEPYVVLKKSPAVPRSVIQSCSNKATVMVMCVFVARLICCGWIWRLCRFDERFTGYGKNKIEFVQHLRFLNFSFNVLPELFVVRLMDVARRSSASGVILHDAHNKSHGNVGVWKYFTGSHASCTVDFIRNVVDRRPPEDR